MLILFLKGLIIGIAIAAPVGPIGILCIQRSLHHGFKTGFWTGMGAAMADGVYGLIAGFGLTAISSFFITQQRWIQWIGGLFLLYLGSKLFFTQAANKEIKDDPPSSSRAFITTFFLTLTNPMTILSFVAVFAGLGLVATNTDVSHALTLVLGIILGSSIWWLSLSSCVAFILHHRLSPMLMQWINRFSGVIIFMFGVLAFWVKL